jgi:hypothetical protein
MRELSSIKVGIVFFGLPRASAMTLPSIQQYIFDELSEYAVFVESCLTEQASIHNPRSNELCQLDQSNYDFFKTKPHEFLLPNALLDTELHARLLQFGDAWEDDGLSLKNILMQLHSLKRAYLRAKQHDCDVYVFVRPDLLIHEYIPIQAFIRQYANKNAAMFVSWQWFGGMNDRFAVASALAADAYALRYDQVLNYCQTYNKPLQGERFLAACLKNAQVAIKTCRTPMSRVRATGEIKAENFSSANGKRGFKNKWLTVVGQVRLQDQVLTLIEMIAYFFYSIAVRLKIAKKDTNKKRP